MTRKKITSTTFQLFIVIAFLFSVTSLVVLTSLNFDLEIVEFLKFPMIFGCQLAVLIWLGLGRQHFIVRLPFSALAFTYLFFLSCIEWLFLYDVPWNQFQWLGFLGGATASVLMFLTPIPLLTIALPLVVYRWHKSGSSQTLTTRQLLFATACVGISLAMAIKLSPYPNWLAEYTQEALSFVTSGRLSINIAIFVMPSLSNMAIAYSAILLFRNRHGSPYTLVAIAITASIVLPITCLAVAKLMWSEMTFDWNTSFYLVGQNFLLLQVVLVSTISMRRSLTIPEKRPWF